MAGTGVLSTGGAFALGLMLTAGVGLAGGVLIAVGTAAAVGMVVGGVVLTAMAVSDAAEGVQNIVNGVTDNDAEAINVIRDQVVKNDDAYYLIEAMGTAGASMLTGMGQQVISERNGGNFEKYKDLGGSCEPSKPEKETYTQKDERTLAGYVKKNAEKGRVNAMDEMMKVISQFENGTYLKLRWQERGGWIGGTIDTIYETCNDLEEADYNDEYYACAFRVIDIFDNSRDIQFHKNELVEISKYNSPDLITRENGDIVYNRVSDSI